MNWDFRDPLIQASFAGAIGAFCLALTKNNSALKSLCVSIVGFLCSVYLTEPIIEKWPFFNQNGLAFVVGLFGCELSEKTITYLSEKFLKNEKNSN